MMMVLFIVEWAIYYYCYGETLGKLTIQMHFLLANKGTWKSVGKSKVDGDKDGDFQRGVLS